MYNEEIEKITKEIKKTGIASMAAQALANAIVSNRGTPFESLYERAKRELAECETHQQ